MLVPILLQSGCFELDMGLEWYADAEPPAKLTAMARAIRIERTL
jgi:hypothetical protein